MSGYRGPGLRHVPTRAETLLFLGAAIATALLAVSNYRSAMDSSSRGDLTDIFLPAAQAILHGHSPYSVAGYVYSPLWALMLVPAVGHPWGVGLATAAMIGCSIVTCWVCARALTCTRPRWQQGLMACVCAVTLLWNWPTLIGLRALRPELLVLLVLVGAALTTGTRSGLAIGLAGVLKTWPAALVVWLLPGRTGRLRRLGGFAVAGLGAVGLAWLTGGVRGIVQMVRVASDSSLQPYAAVSVPGAARLFFSANPIAEPVFVSAPLRSVAMVIGCAGLLALLVIVWRRPGNRFVALFNLVFIVQLALPVSHYSYFVLSLPALWFWTARALSDRDDVSIVATIALALWWIFTARNPYLIDQAGHTSLIAYSYVFVPTLVAATVSTLAAAHLLVTSDDPSIRPTSTTI